MKNNFIRFFKEGQVTTLWNGGLPDKTEYIRVRIILICEEFFYAQDDKTGIQYKIPTNHGLPKCEAYLYKLLEQQTVKEK